jgi:hypothetical protein
MNSNLTQYLSDVFRKEPQNNSSLELKENDVNLRYLNDRKLNHFLVDGKYTLRLDEII